MPQPAAGLPRITASAQPRFFDAIEVPSPQGETVLKGFSAATAKVHAERGPPETPEGGSSVGNVKAINHQPERLAATISVRRAAAACAVRTGLTTFNGKETYERLSSLQILFYHGILLPSKVRTRLINLSCEKKRSELPKLGRREIVYPAVRENVHA